MAGQDISNPIVFLGCYVQRFSATLGLNSTPTTIEMELIEGNPNVPYDTGRAATGFLVGAAYPGRFSGLTVGAFNFVGCIQSWTKNYSSQGITYSVRMADPRVIFDNVIISLDGKNTLDTNVDNYLDAFKYYGNPVSADSNEQGMTFSKIRNYLTTTGYINAYEQKFNFSFTSGFLDGSGSANPSGIPSWYRINVNQISLNQLISQVTTDMNMDCYCIMPVATFTSGSISTLQIKHIFRENTGVAADIDNFITNTLASGTRISYRRGQELRTEPTTVVLHGPEKTYWIGANTAQIYPYWGRADDGSAIWVSSSPESGVVLLDHIVGSGATNIVNTVSVEKITLQKLTVGDIYPPRVTRTFTTQNVSGYRPSPNIMRAALYNQESWEAMLFKEQQTFAETLGIKSSLFKTGTEFINKISEISGLWQDITLKNIGSGTIDRTPIQEELIKAVYDATRSTCEEFYGKSWIIDLDTSLWLVSGTFDSSELIPRIEFSIADAGWSEASLAMPSGVTNHELLNDTNKPKFKDTIGKLKAFISLPNYKTSYDATFPYSINTAGFGRDSSFIEQGDKLVVGITAEAYEKDPDRGIVTMDYPIEGLVGVSGYNEHTAIYEFLIAMGYTSNNIREYNLIKNPDDNKFGLAPPRAYRPVSAPGNYGIHIPLQSNKYGFGPFLASGTRNGGVQSIVETSLGPWTYGSYSKFNQAGQDLSNKSLTTETVVDLAEITVAGLPLFNIGDPLGSNSIVNGISFQLGPDGFNTTYSIRSFIYPQGRVTKLLTEKITNAYNDIDYAKKQLVILQDRVQNDLLTKPSEITRSNSKGQEDLGVVDNNGYLTSVVPPGVSGIYDPDSTPWDTQ